MFAKRARLFGKNIEPACLYCTHGRPSPDQIMILCRKYGPVAAHYKCRHFIYNPLKRIPKRLPALPEFTAEDFEI